MDGLSPSRTAFAALTLLLLCGCSQITTLQASDKKAVVAIKDSPLTESERTEEFSNTSFGQYEFKVTDSKGKTLYGILPLQFDGGHLAVDILFFPPGFFFNLRGVYPFYEFDTMKGVVRYRARRGKNWREYKPLPEHIERAKLYFDKAAENSTTQP